MKHHLMRLSGVFALMLLSGQADATLQLAVDRIVVSERDASALVTVFRGEDGTTSGVGETANLFAVAGTAVPGIDYRETAGSVSFATGDYEAKTFAVPLLDNGQPDGSRTFTVQLDPGSAGVVRGRTMTEVAIVDDETSGPGSVTLGASQISVVEGISFADITINRENSGAGAISVQVSTTTLATGDPNLAAQAVAGTDYIATSTTVSWADGEVGAKVARIQIIQDALIEGSEFFSVILDNFRGGVQPGPITRSSVQIVDDDQAQAGSLGLAPVTVTVGEGSEVELAVTRSGGSAGVVSVSFSTSDGSGTEGLDYVPARGVLTWEDGDVEARQIVIPTRNNGIVTSPRTFTVALSSPSGGASIEPARSSSTVSINDANGQPAGSIGLTSPSLSVDSGDGFVTVLVSRTGRSDTAASVDVTTSDISAIAGDHYTAVDGTLTWAAGESGVRAITIPIRFTNGTETRNLRFGVTLSNNQGAAIRADGLSSVITIEYRPGDANTGCSITGRRANDPLLGLMVAGAVAVLLYRRRKAGPSR